MPVRQNHRVPRPTSIVVVSVLILLYSLGSTCLIVFSGKLNGEKSPVSGTVPGIKPGSLDHFPIVPKGTILLNTIWDSDEAENGFSACLLVMDDNHFLSEWIAYHYFTTNLRTLIIASDPKSWTTPFPILDRWKDHIRIIYWNQDEDYMTVTEFQEAKTNVERYFTHTTPQLVEHRARQRIFYTKCMKQLKQMNASWTLFLDTDEFVHINYQLAEHYNMTATRKKDNNHNQIVRPVQEPGSVARLLQESNNVSLTPIIQAAKEHMPLFILQSSPCVQVPRIRYVSTDDDQNTAEGSLSMLDESSPVIDTKSFLTLRYRHHTYDGDLKRNKISKAILDLRRIPEQDIAPVDSIHMPVRTKCEQRRLHTQKSRSLLVINHYMGSYEQYTYRDNDARHGLEQAKNNQKRTAQQFVESQQLKHPETDDEIQPWISGFLQATGLPVKALLKDVGKLEKKSWRTFEGDPATDRCALLFFGLPRAFKTMVLPSIVTNLLIPNARHHCDVFVHFYQQHEEAPGRRNRGGDIHPEDVFMLKDAVRQVFEEFGPKHGSRAADGQLKPIVAFTHDTSEQFLEKRKDLLERYHNATGPNGKPIYFPWAAKTYTHTVLDNVVRQWHSVEYAFKLMDFKANQYEISYSRVGMFRSDALYMTPIDIAIIDTKQGIADTTNSYFVSAPFALYPVNDRSIYGPYNAVKVWATQRFDLIEERAELATDPGYIMHSERFMKSSIFPAMEKVGFIHAINPDICFARTRADESAIVSDCSVGGTTRNWDAVNKLDRVESIIRRKCVPFQMGFKWKFVGCGDNQEYKDGKEIGWLT